MNIESLKRGDYLKYQCIECGKDSFIHDGEHGMWKCFQCGKGYKNEEVHSCV